MLSKLATERMLMRRELIDRVKSGRLFYTPQGDYAPVGFEKK
jgi:hypothetical protein